MLAAIGLMALLSAPMLPGAGSAAAQAPNAGDLRLQGMASATAGRLEIFRNNEWGGVCDDGFGAEEVAVAVRQLGFADGALVDIRLPGPASGKIWLDDVSCTGSESRLDACSSSPVVHNCFVDIESVVLTASAAAPPSDTLRFLRADPGDSQLVLYWHAPMDENGQAVRDHDYQYRYKTDSGTFGSWIGFFARFVRHDEMQLFVGELSNGTPYTVEVRAVRNGVGGQPASVTATPGSPDATLSTLGLTSSSGTIALSPPFPSTRRGGLRYTASVTHDVTSVTVTAETNNADAQVAFDPATDADTVAMGHQVALVGGENVISVTVTAKNGATKKTYIVTVDRALPPALAVADAEATEGDDATLDFVVTLDPVATATVTVDYATADGTATAGDDYTGTSGTLTFTVGETTKTVSVPITDDTTEDDGETLTLTLSNASGAEIADAEATGTIQETRELSVADAEATEGDDATLDFVVTLDPVATVTVTVDYATADGTATAGDDYTGTSGTLTFTVGETTKTVSVPITDDTTEDDGETLTLTLSNASGAEIADAEATGTIQETRELSVADAEATEGDDATLDFVVTLDPVATVTVTVDYATADGTATAGDDYTGTSGTLTFTVGETTKTVSVPITDDTTEDDGETLTLTLSNASGAEIADAEATGTIRNTEADLLTASFSNLPDQHTGADFTFDLTFTDELAAGWRKVQNAFRVSDGSINRVWRKMRGSDLGWNIKVRPAGTDSVTITLPATTNCSSSDGICTNDGRKLSNSPSVTVAGASASVETTPTVSIAGGSGKEGDDSSISFTVTLDEAASGTVTVDYATSDGTADAGDDYAAASGTLSFSAGTTSKIVSVSISDDSENENDESFTVTLSNASGADLGNSSATGTIENRYVAPLTARFENMPSEHDGSEFTFELHFSESPEVPYRRLRDRSFTLVQADVIKAKRQNPQAANKNQSWTITVEPLGTGEVSITLPAAVSCTDDKSICTGDGRKLSHATSATIAGPPLISVADATVTEAAGAVLAFTVSLSRSSGSNVTVDYATSDGTATAGADYTATSGTLTISAGSTSATVDVTVLDDSHDDGGETLTLTLSNPTNGTLGDSTATGTIENSDPLPKALIARFGRTAAVHIVEQVEERVNAPRQPGFDGRLAGRQVNGNMGRDFALDFLQQLGGGAGYTPMGTGQPVPSRGGATTGAAAMGHAGGAPVNGGGLTPMGAGGMQPMQPGHGPDGIGMGLGHGSLLTGSGFALNRVTKTGGILSFWSRSAQSQFYGQDGALALNGDVRTSMFGADYSKGRMVTGVSLSHSRGLGSYAGVDNGRVTSAVTGLYPWIGYKASERVTVWTVAGYGAGGLLLNPGAGTPVETGLSMAMAAGGGRGQILGGGEGFGLAFKADALWVGTRTDESNGPNGRLRGTSAAVNRLRTAIEGSQSMQVGGRIALTPSVEVGIRQDGGDAERGTGMDVGAGLVFADAMTGLSVDVRVRTLVVHQAEGYAERGVSISVSYNPTPSTPLGFTARVSPAWGGDSMSGAEALWGRETMDGMGRNHLLGGGGNRLDTEVGYGLLIGARFIGTPRVGLVTSEYGRDYRVGYGMQVLEQGRLNLELGIDAERRQSPVFHLQERSGGADQRVLGRATVQW